MTSLLHDPVAGLEALFRRILVNWDGLLLISILNVDWVLNLVLGITQALLDVFVITQLLFVLSQSFFILQSLLVELMSSFIELHLLLLLM